jgi:hypothetical protein
MFDSPLGWCARCKAWVALDQTFAQCALAPLLKPQTDTSLRSASRNTTSSSSTSGNSR